MLDLPLYPLEVVNSNPSPNPNPSPQHTPVVELVDCGEMLAILRLCELWHCPPSVAEQEDRVYQSLALIDQNVRNELDSEESEQAGQATDITSNSGGGDHSLPPTPASTGNRAGDLLARQGSESSRMMSLLMSRQDTTATDAG